MAYAAIEDRRIANRDSVARGSRRMVIAFGPDAAQCADLRAGLVEPVLHRPHLRRRGAPVLPRALDEFNTSPE